MNNVVFKCADINDIDALTYLRIDYFKKDAYENFSEDEEIKLRSSVKSYFEEHLCEDCLCFICYEKDIPVSCVIMLIYEKPANRGCPNGKFAEILGVYTEKSYRNKGYASQLVQMAINKANELNLSYIELGASGMGLNMYSRLGFNKYEDPYQTMHLKLF